MSHHSIKINLWKFDDDGFHITIKASLNGMSIRMLVDTGANHSCFDRHFFTDLFGNECIKGSDEHNVGIGGNDFETVIATVSHLKIGQVKIPEMEVRLLDLSQVNAMYTMVGYSEIQGIVGGDFLEQFKAIINYSDHTLTFYK